MRRTRFQIMVGCWLIAGALSSPAQTKKMEIATRRAGLWELTTTMTWQQSPFAPGTASGIAEGGKHTKMLCLTQEMIDNYGALLPQSHGE